MSQIHFSVERREVAGEATLRRGHCSNFGGWARSRTAAKGRRFWMPLPPPSWCRRLWAGPALSSAGPPPAGGWSPSSEAGEAEEGEGWTSSSASLTSTRTLPMRSAPCLHRGAVWLTDIWPGAKRQSKNGQGAKINNYDAQSFRCKAPEGNFDLLGGCLKYLPRRRGVGAPLPRTPYIEPCV